ncbi:MAG TPA: hypothetical protein VFX59_31375, partial [Polyangiales bacterium]|nr:hypothetical protein [Polyangiales bacterium]
MADHGQRAIVIGGSIAGLLAARVLRERFAHVTVIAGEAQRGQQGLLAGGLAAIETLFPGFAEAARFRGARVFDVGEFARWSLEGVTLPSMTTGLRGLVSSELAP